ncbi:MAG: hypothetical protein V3V10_05655 [Planctomycetota bacterium]
MIWWILLTTAILAISGFMLAMVTGLIREKTGAESAASGYLKSWRG